MESAKSKSKVREGFEADEEKGALGSEEDSPEEGADVPLVDDTNDIDEGDATV